jgi:hypothetical protein
MRRIRWDTVFMMTFLVIFAWFMWSVLDRYANSPAGDVPFYIYLLLYFMFSSAERIGK